MKTQRWWAVHYKDKYWTKDPSAEWRITFCFGGTKSLAIKRFDDIWEKPGEYRRLYKRGLAKVVPHDLPVDPNQKKDV